MKPAAIMASLVDVRNVAAHKSVRLEIHVPAEQAGLVLEAFGWPTAVNPVPVAVARINPQTVKDAPEHEITQPELTTPPPKEPRPWATLAYPMQAGIRCNEPKFWEFLSRAYDLNKIDNAEEAANLVRGICWVKSRSEIIRGTSAGTRWEFLESAYQAWLTEHAS